MAKVFEPLPQEEGKADELLFVVPKGDVF